MFSEEEFQVLRHQMVDEHLRPRGIRDERVLEAMAAVPRHLFVPEQHRQMAYYDGPLPIGEDQTISQPYIVALMTQLLALQGDERILEIGTGSGYQTAVLCQLAAYVYSLERFPLLARHAADTLTALGYHNTDIHVGDGSQGLADMGPFEAIIVTAAAPAVPGPLCAQLHPQLGRLVIPIGSRENQFLQVVYRQDNTFRVEESIGVRFVPLLGKYGFPGDDNAPSP